MGANAQTAVPVFTAGQVLTAAQQTQINTGVPVFATTVTRDAAFGTGKKVLAEGQFAYIEATNSTQYYDGAAWQSVSVASGVVQVKSTTKSDTFTMSSTTFADVTGLTISITPTSASNKILVIATVNLNGNSGVNNAMGRLMRDSTAIAIGDADGIRTQASFGGIEFANATSLVSTVLFLDSPATTSATTYKIQIRSNAAAAVYVNRTQNDANSADLSRTISSITVFEVTP